MKKFSFLIVCLCAGLTFVSQAQDTERIAPTSGDAPSLNGGRPSPWERPIGPGPVDHPNGGSGSGDVTDDDGSGGSPLEGLVKGSVKPGSEPNVSQAPSLNGGRPTPWDRPIGPGPRPIIANGGSGNVTVTDDDDTGGSPLDGLVKGSVKPGSEPNVSQTPSLNGGRPSPWDKPIGPGPRPIIANGGSGNVTVTDDDDTGGSPLDGLTKATVRPGTNPNVAMGKCSGSSGSPMVYDVAEVLVGGFASVPDVNGDGKIDVNDFDAMFDLLLNEQ